MSNQNKKKLEKNFVEKKNTPSNIFPSQKSLEVKEQDWSESINKLKGNNYQKLSLAIEDVVLEVINKLNIDKSNEDLKTFLYDMCSDNPFLLESIEKELL